MISTLESFFLEKYRYRTPRDSGYCYLAFFLKKYRRQVSLKLGKMPRFREVAEFLIKNKNMLVHNYHQLRVERFKTFLHLHYTNKKNIKNICHLNRVLSYYDEINLNIGMVMSRETFVTQNHNLKVTEKLKRLVKGITVEMEFHRVNLPDTLEVRSNSLIITPNTTYIPNEMMEKMRENKVEYLEFWELFSTGFDAEFTLMSEVDTVFSTSKYIRKLSLRRNRDFYDADYNPREKKPNVFYDYTHQVATEEEWYFYCVLSSDPKRKSLSMRMAPMEDEYFIMKKMLDSKLYPKFNCKTIKNEQILTNVINVSKEQLKTTLEFYEAVFIPRKKDRVEESASLLSDYRTSLMEVTKDVLTYSKFKFWERSRHNIFGQVVCNLMEWNMDQEFDVNMNERFDYWGQDCQKTPDYVLELEDKIYILDFAVTTGNAGQTRDTKKKKYENLREGLSYHLNKEVEVEAIVWKVNRRDEFQIPSFINGITPDLLIDEVLNFLHEVHLTISMMEDYQRFRVMDDMEDDEDPRDLSNKLMYFDNHINSKMMDKDKYVNKKCYTVEDGRGDDRNPMMKQKRLHDSEYHQSLRNRENFDKGFYRTNLMSEISQAIDNNDIHPELSSIMYYNEDKIKAMIDRKIKEANEVRAEFKVNTNWGMPKMFKFPYFEISGQDMPYAYQGYTPDFWGSERQTEDGTIYIRGTLDFKDQKELEDKEKLLGYNMKGLGINEEEDETWVNGMVEWMMEERGVTGLETTIISDKDHLELSLKKTNLWEILDSWGNMMENLSYLEGRRHMFDKSKGHTVFKNFGQYMLMIKSGSMMTAQKQIRFKVFIHKSSYKPKNDSYFQKFRESERAFNFMETKWLSVSITDIRHFLKCREVALGLLSDIDDKIKENRRGIAGDISPINKSYITQIILYLEHKRGTSTTAQLNRYLFNSVTSYISNRNKLVEDINSDPIRSRVEAYIRLQQFRWYRLMLGRSEKMWYDRILSLASTSTDYDRLKVPSFYDLEQEIEFSEMMNEMYTCNLFDKSAGFTEHRMKRIVDKMSVAELHYLKVKDRPESKGEVEDLRKFWRSKDELHMFDEKFVISATREYFEYKANKIKVKEAIMASLSSVIDSAMMMTSSLVSGPLKSEALSFTDRIQKTKSFLSLQKIVQESSTNLLSELVNQWDSVDAIFTIFPKDQIGGPREILIQSVMLRVSVKFLESVSKEFCKMHEKEMLTKDRRKAEIQADKMSEYKDTLRSLRANREVSVFCSLNADSSKWAPGFVMEHFILFVNNWDIPQEMKEQLIAVINCFSQKRILVPESLKRKWAKKDKKEVEHLEGVEFFRTVTDKMEGIVTVKSGMGQGMMHFLSSFYHCVIDDYCEGIIKDVLRMKYSTIINESSLISSDDKTKMMMMVFKKGAKTSEDSLRSYIKMMDMLGRLGNIHINWKKSGLNFVMTEFNSLFSLGKRMQWATVKDIYTANSLPDLSSPEEAVTFMNSNIRRCLEHGMFFPTVKRLMMMARNQLIRYYRYDKTLIKDMCNLLNCKEEDLPFQLGFYPNKLMVETLLYGLEVNMFDRNLSKELQSFYHKIYSAQPSENYKVVRGYVPFSESSAGKYWFELPTRLDKKLVDLKREFFEDAIHQEPEELIKAMDLMSLNINSKATDFKMHVQFTKEFFVGMKRKYEFQDTMVVHSLIRALQLTKGKGVVFPKQEEFIDLEEKIKLMDSKIKRMMKLDENIEMEAGDLEILKGKMKNHTYDIYRFTQFILSRENPNSSIHLYKGLREVVNIFYDIQERLAHLPRSYRFSHPTMRTMRFYLNDIGVGARPEEIMNYLFDRTSDFRNSTINALENIIKSSGKIFDYDIHSDPFKFIRDLMGNMEHPYKAFKDYLTLNYKSLRFMKISMLSDNPCLGNMRDNMFNLYRTKISPEYILDEDRNSIYREENTLDFLTGVSLKKPFKQNMALKDYMFTIDLSDNPVVRAMKLRSYSKDDWVDPMAFNYRRLDYKQYRDKRRDCKVKQWTTLRSMAKSYEYGNRADIFIYSMEDLDNSENLAQFTSALRRYVGELNEKGLTYEFKRAEEATSDGCLSYNVRPLQFRTFVKYNNTNWTLTLQVKTEFPLIFDKWNEMSSEFHVLKDSYTVDHKSLMELEIIDEFEEVIKVNEIMTNIPDIEALDKIFMQNSWLQEITITQGEDMSDKDKYSVAALNESFGISSVQNVLSGMFDVKGMKEKLTAEEEVKMTVPEMGQMKGLIDALLKVEEDGDSVVVEFNPYERNSIMKSVDYLVSKSAPMSIIVEKDKMKRFQKSCMTSSTSNGHSRFHNMLLWQIMRAFEFNLSDTMAIIIYNIILKNSASLVDQNPMSNLTKRGEELLDKVPEAALFVKRAGDDDEMFEEVGSFFD